MVPFDFEKRAQELIDTGQESDLRRALIIAASEDLKKHVRAANWTFLEPGEPLEFPLSGGLVVIGVVTWDEPEMTALRHLASSRPKKAITVVDLDQLRTQDAVLKVLPGVSKVLQTPVVAEYTRGVLTRHAEGKAGLELVHEIAADKSIG